MDTTSSTTYQPAQTPADLFADSFDEWIEARKKAPAEASDSLTATKWVVHPNMETPDLGADGTEGSAEMAAPELSASDSWRRRVGWAALGLGALLLIVPLFPSLSSGFKLNSLPAETTSLPRISRQKRMGWQK